jgi:AcrR family transcriptional regulator
MATSPKSDAAGRDTRTRILDATEELMLEEGYAGVSSRKVSARAGLKSKILHYYFATMDDLFIAAFQRREDEHFAQFAGAAASATPLRDLWTLAIDAANSKLYLEFNALASHRPKVREFIARSNARDRLAMTTALQSVFQRNGIDTGLYPPEAVATAIAGMARVFATDKALGTEEGHAAVLRIVDRVLSWIEPGVPPAHSDTVAT